MVKMCFNLMQYLINYAIYVPDPLSTRVSHSETPIEGTSVTLTCDITDGRPTVIKHVTWKKGDETLPTSTRYQYGDKDLTISSLSHTLDDGHYSCAAKNKAGTGSFSAKFHLLVNCKLAFIFN